MRKSDKCICAVKIASSVFLERGNTIGNEAVRPCGS